MNFVETIIDFISRFWPFAIVEQWERGVFYTAGRARRLDPTWWLWRAYPRLGLRAAVADDGLLLPGFFVFVPWFMRIDGVSMVPSPISSPLVNITLSDNKTLSYSVTAIVRVTDAWFALNAIDDYRESATELITSKTSEKLAEVDAARLDTGSRKRLITDLVRWVNEDTQQYGVEVIGLRFANFAVNQKSLRVMTDAAIGTQTW